MSPGPLANRDVCVASECLFFKDTEPSLGPLQAGTPGPPG